MPPTEERHFGIKNSTKRTLSLSLQLLVVSEESSRDTARLGPAKVARPGETVSWQYEGDPRGWHIRGTAVYLERRGAAYRAGIEGKDLESGKTTRAGVFGDPQSVWPLELTHEDRTSDSERNHVVTRTVFELAEGPVKPVHLPDFQKNVPEQVFRRAWRALVAGDHTAFRQEISRTLRARWEKEGGRLHAEWKAVHGPCGDLTYVSVLDPNGGPIETPDLPAEVYMDPLGQRACPHDGYFRMKLEDGLWKLDGIQDKLGAR